MARGERPVGVRGALCHGLPSRPLRRSINAFTLIEVMVVVLIMGLLYGLAVFTVGDPRQDALEETAQRLRASLSLARDEAVIRAVPLGLETTETGYVFLTLNEDGDWQPMEQDRALGERTLPEFVTARVTLESLPGDGGAAEEDTNARQPQLVLLPTGGLTPFTITLAADEGELEPWVLEGAIDGTITLRR